MNSFWLWLVTLVGIALVAVALVTGAWSTLVKRGFRARLKADATILSHLPNQSQTREALLASIDARIAVILKRPKPQDGVSVTLMRIASSVVGIGALEIAGLFVSAILGKHDCAGWEDPRFVPALLTLYIGFIAMTTGSILVFALLTFRGYRWWRERQGSRTR